MSTDSTVVERSLARARARWKWLRFLRHSAELGACVCVLVFGIGVLIQFDAIHTKPEAIALVLLVTVLAFGAWVLISIKVLVSAPRQASLAATFERLDHRFQDRLNTLLFLETKAAERNATFFRWRIAQQARRLLDQRTARVPFSAVSSVAWIAAFAVLAGGLCRLNQQFSPWKRLANATGISRQPVMAKAPLAAAVPAKLEPSNWGEVRITNPGADLKLTKVDVLPLAIEAAANRDLNTVSWASSVNGAPETVHPLPASKEPRYASYEPVIYLDELELSDWDVVTYYAQAKTVDASSYASEVFFVEVRPFREDIVKMPGGEGGQAYGAINEITSLIGRQQQVIRETHRYVQHPLQEEVRGEERARLAQVEGDVGNAAQHLYAEMVAKMENKPIGAALDNLAKAETSLARASQFLKDDAITPAQEQERAALTDLVASRKIFQKAVSDHPGDFDQNTQGDPGALPDPSKRLAEIAEFRDEAKSAQQFVQSTLEEQKELEKQAGTGVHESSGQLAQQEQELEKQLKQFRDQHPRGFKGAEAESQQAQQALQEAAKSLTTANGPSAAHQATEGLDKLRAAMQAQADGQQMANVYRLKRMIDEQARALGNLKPEANLTQESARHMAQAAQDVVDQLKKSLAPAAMSNAFGQPIKRALSNPGAAAFDEKLSRLAEAQTDGERHDFARAAAESLAVIGKSFEASQPKALQAARQTDSLQPAPNTGFAQGMSELESLLKRLEEERSSSAVDQRKQANQAKGSLEAGLRGQFGVNAAGEALLQQLDQMLATPHGLTSENLRNLLGQLQKFAAESAAKPGGKGDAPEVALVDPARLPAAYRGRIERYFQKLSEE